MPGNTRSRWMASDSYRATSRVRLGRGPTSDIWPARTLSSWGSSSSEYLRMNRPTDVMRGSFWSLNSTELICPSRLTRLQALLGIDDHRAELDDVEGPAVFAYALLAEEHRAAAGQLDGRGDGQADGQEEQRDDGGQDEGSMVAWRWQAPTPSAGRSTCSIDRPAAGRRLRRDPATSTMPGATTSSTCRSARAQPSRRRGCPVRSGWLETATTSAPVRSTALRVSSGFPSTGRPSTSGRRDEVVSIPDTQAPTMR